MHTRRQFIVQATGAALLGWRGVHAQAPPSAAIPGVEKFERLRQVSPKNGYAFGFSMEFADQAAYDGYNRHPDHVAFVEGRWIPEVAEFLEIDYAPL